MQRLAGVGCTKGSPLPPHAWGGTELNPAYPSDAVVHLPLYISTHGNWRLDVSAVADYSAVVAAWRLRGGRGRLRKQPQYKVKRMPHANDGQVRTSEVINGRLVVWMWGLGEGVEEATRQLIARFPELGSPVDPLVVGWSPWPQDPVFLARRVGDDDGSYRFLGVGNRWWSAPREQLEYDYVMAMLIGDHAESGEVEMTEKGLHLRGVVSTSEHVDVAEYLNEMAGTLIERRR